jgi:hypothetical protein
VWKRTRLAHHGPTWFGKGLSSPCAAGAYEALIKEVPSHNVFDGKVGGLVSDKRLEAPGR